MVAWCDAHPDSYPPTVLHVTDGESNDGEPEEIAVRATAKGTARVIGPQNCAAEGSAGGSRDV